MSHPPSHTQGPLAQLEPYDDPEPGSLWFISLAGVILLVALVVVISAINFETEHHEFTVKVVNRGDGAVPPPSTAPLGAAGVRTMASELDTKLDAGIIGRAEYTRRSQGLLLNAWMRYPWENSKGQTQQLIRIPIDSAMKIISDEYSAKSAAKPMAATASSQETPTP